ncbi:urea carboxylase-associated family protein [Chloroflexi bacterium TSY]|nr:urea carboxylase-associated family protein [Chloroflexi bacterium TSY]
MLLLITKEKEGAYLNRTARIWEKAREKQKAGAFTQVDEFIAEPYQGYSFDVKKGQSFRFELLEGNQILDIIFVNQHNRDEHYAMYPFSAIRGPAPLEGYTFMSNSPYMRGMATIIRDTVDYNRLDAAMGSKGVRHIFAYNNARCDEAFHEVACGTKNVASCKSNILDELNRLGGEALMMPFKETQVVAIFQPNQWVITDGTPMMKYWESHNMFRAGDYVEMIAEQDLTVVFSPCPLGGQTNLKDPTRNICWPVSVKTFDTGLELPDIPICESMEPVEFVKQGRPNVNEYGRGVSGDEASFAWEAKRRGE